MMAKADANNGSRGLQDESEDEHDDLHDCEDESSFREYVQAYGVQKIWTMISNNLERFKRQKIRLAVAGSSGSGKSSLINTIRGLRSRDEGAARVGVRETTTEIQSYIHPDIPNYILNDLPGISPNFPRASYFEKMELAKFHCLIICSKGRFTEDDLWLAKKAHECKVPFVFLHTNVDDDVRNFSYDEGEDFNEEECLRGIRNEIEGHLSRAIVPYDGAVFLISTRLDNIMQWDYGDLLMYIRNHLPRKVLDAYVLTMATVTKDIIMTKREMLQNRIKRVASLAAFMSIRGANGDDLLQREYKLYEQQLGLPSFSASSGSRSNVYSLGDILVGASVLLAWAKLGPLLLVGVVFIPKFLRLRKEYIGLLSNKLDEIVRSSLSTVDSGRLSNSTSTTLCIQ